MVLSQPNSSCVQFMLVMGTSESDSIANYGILTAKCVISSCLAVVQTKEGHAANAASMLALHGPVKTAGRSAQPQILVRIPCTTSGNRI